MFVVGEPSLGLLLHSAARFAVETTIEGFKARDERRHEWQQMKIKAISDNKRNLITKRPVSVYPPRLFNF